MNTNTVTIDEMTPEQLKEYRKQKARETRKRNQEAREAKRQQRQADHDLIVATLRSVLEDDKATTRQRLRAAQLLSTFVAK